VELPKRCLPAFDLERTSVIEGAGVAHLTFRVVK
jgi:hypothetical protein